MKNNFKKITAAITALMMSAALTACGGSSENTETTADSASETSAAASENAGDSTGNADELLEETATWATVTDVENEVDRAIYKAQVTLPDGWQLLQDTSEGKMYRSATGIFTIQAQNYGADAELQDLATLADGMAASIKMNNMFQHADTEFGEPQDVTVAGLPAVKYDYTVTSYVYDVDDEGNMVEGSKHVFGEFADEFYVLYSGTDAYALRFECIKDDLSKAKPDFDKIIESFTIAEDGTAGYEAASEFMASQSEALESAQAAQSEQEAQSEQAESGKDVG